METHRELTDGSNASPGSTLLSSYSQVFLLFFLQVQNNEIACYILSSCATSHVRAASLSAVPVKHCCLEEDLGCSLCGGLFIAHSSWSFDRENARNNEMRTSSSYTSTSNDFHAALFVDEYLRPSIDVCTIGNSPILHTNLAQPPSSVQLRVCKLSKSCQNFLNLLVKEKEL